MVPKGHQQSSRPQIPVSPVSNMDRVFPVSGFFLFFVFFMSAWHLDIWPRIGEKYIASRKVVVEQNLCVQWQWVTICIFLLYNMLEFWGRLPFQNPCICEMPFQHGNTKHTLYCIIRLFQLIFSTFYSSSKTLIKTLYH